MFKKKRIFLKNSLLFFFYVVLPVKLKINLLNIVPNPWLRFVKIKKKIWILSKDDFN